MTSMSAGEKRARSESETSGSSVEGNGSTKHRQPWHGSRGFPPAQTEDGIQTSSTDPKREKGKEGHPQSEDQLYVVSTPSGSVEANVQMVITTIRATDVALGLRRLPAGFYAVIRHGGLEWRTENKSSSVTDDAVEWNGRIPIPSDLSATVLLQVYASFEFQPMLGDGEQLRRLTITVEQLLDSSAKEAPINFSPKDGDVVSPCSSILMTIQRQTCENDGSSSSRVLDPHFEKSRGELEDATNRGHSALSHYRKQGGTQYLERAIRWFERALSICSLNHPCRAAAESNLATVKFIFRQVENTRASLEVPLALYRNALAMRPPGHPDRPSTLIQLSAVQLAQFQEGSDETVGARIEALLYEVIELDSTGGHEKRAATFMLRLHAGCSAGRLPVDGGPPVEQDSIPDSTEEDLWILSIRLLKRAKRFGDLADLQQAIAVLEELIRSTPVWDESYRDRLGNLGVALRCRFEQLGKLSDLEDAISTLRGAVNLTPHDHSDKPARLNNLGNTLLTRFERLGDLDDLEDAISMHKDAVRLTPHGHPDKPGRLNNLGTSFRTRFERLGVLSDLRDAISMHQDAVDLTPDGHPGKPGRLNNLGNIFFTRFKHLGKLIDLEDAISRHRDAVDLTPDGDPNKPTRLHNLGTTFFTRFEHLGEPSDLEDAISMHRNAVCLTPHGHSDEPRHLSSLGNSFLTRFEHFDEPNDLDDAISRHRDAVRLIPRCHPDKSRHLHNLGSTLSTRFEHLGELSDLEDAIRALKDAVDLTPHGHPAKPHYLGNLGNIFSIRFQHLRELSDLENAISMHRNAVELTPHGHPHRSLFLTNLGNSFKTGFECLRKPSYLERAISIYSYVASSPVGPAYVRFNASQKWISCARQIRHKTLLHACSIAVNLLPQLAWIGLPLTLRYSELRQGADVVREAAAAALDSGRPETAVEWLEQGRSIVWRELFQLRSSYEELSSAHPDHARRLRDLSAALDHAGAVREKAFSALWEQTNSTAHHDFAPDTLQRGAERYHRLAIERDALILEIRKLPSFEQFLLRKPFSQLRASAHSGPVVFLNAAENRCDALIVLASLDHVIHVPLPNFTLGRCAALQNTLRMLLGSTRVMRSGERDARRARLRGVNWESFLSPVWKCVVKPVLDALSFSIPGALSRLFWCPTGPFVFLPFHAAGFYDIEHSEPGHKIFDFVVSSYLPCLAILAPSPHPTPVSRDDLRFLAVGQPPSDGQSPLPGVATELAYVKDVIGSSPSARAVIMEPSVGTVEEVLSLMKNADWVHFACHGIQDGVNPTSSGLCLANRRRLKLRDIVALAHPRGGLAFLSACQTAMGEERLPDEAIHIAAGMLFAGYGGVVGTMWSISDRLAPRVARDVYTPLFRNGGRPDYREAARALHDAIGGLRDSGVPFAEWLPFIHIGL